MPTPSSICITPPNDGTYPNNIISNVDLADWIQQLIDEGVLIIPHPEPGGGGELPNVEANSLLFNTRSTPIPLDLVDSVSLEEFKVLLDIDTMTDTWLDDKLKAGDVGLTGGGSQNSLGFGTNSDRVGAFNVMANSILLASNTNLNIAAASLNIHNESQELLYKFPGTAPTEGQILVASVDGSITWNTIDTGSLQDTWLQDKIDETPDLESLKINGSPLKGISFGDPARFGSFRVFTNGGIVFDAGDGSRVFVSTPTGQYGFPDEVPPVDGSRYIIASRGGAVHNTEWVQLPEAPELPTPQSTSTTIDWNGFPTETLRAQLSTLGAKFVLGVSATSPDLFVRGHRNVGGEVLWELAYRDPSRDGTPRSNVAIRIEYLPA